ncbi:MAG: hypothetical protein HQK77_00420 [Desulfobacterales bacterium]|nr:hypothetical protein [Desulfobacterales bacterium]
MGLKQTVMVLMLLCMMFTTCYAEDSAILAKGDGIVITKEDMEVLRSRYAKTFTTTEAEYCQALIRTKLFALAAKEKKVDQLPEFKMNLEQMINEALANYYVQRIIFEYQLSNETIESYYLSHTNEFTNDKGELMPLDDQLKSQIKDIVMKLKQVQIIESEMEKLKKQYHIEILDPVCIKGETTK